MSNSRLCSLLLDNVEVEELCQLAVQEMPQIPTYKLLPPMYQLAARLGGAGGLNELLVGLIRTTAKEHPYHVLPTLFALRNAQLDYSFSKCICKGAVVKGRHVEEVRNLLAIIN